MNNCVTQELSWVRRGLRRGLFPAGLLFTLILVVLVGTGRIDPQAATATAPLFFLVVLSLLELRFGRWRPAARRLPRDLSLLLAGAGLDVLARVAAAPLVLAWGSRGFGPIAALPPWQAAVLGLLTADLAAYAVHRAFHQVPLLWRMHTLHHAPRELYALMSAVNAPLMVFFVRALPLLLLVALGFPPLSLSAYALVDAWIGLTSHTGVDTHNPWLSRIFVTPEVHRLHHSDAPAHHGNHGLTWTLWDRVFGTFVAPALHPGTPRPGLSRAEDFHPSWLGQLVLRAPAPRAAEASQVASSPQ